MGKLQSNLSTTAQLGSTPISCPQQKIFNRAQGRNEWEWKGAGEMIIQEWRETNLEEYGIRECLNSELDSYGWSELSERIEGRFLWQDCKITMTHWINSKHVQLSMVSLKIYR